MAKSRKWYKSLCECSNCRIVRLEQFAYGEQAATASIVCKGCGCKGTMSIVGPAPKKVKAE